MKKKCFSKAGRQKVSDKFVPCCHSSHRSDLCGVLLAHYLIEMAMKKADTTGRVLKMDKINKEILKILQENSKVTNAWLAKKVGLSTAPTLERVKKLEANGYVQKYQAKLDGEKLGLAVTTFVLVRQKLQSSDEKEKFIANIKKIPEVVESYHVAGEIDFLLKIMARNFEAYEEVLGTLNQEGKVVTRSLVVLRSNKDSVGLPIY